MVKKCIHDMIPETCSFCKGKPLKEVKPPTDIISRPPIVKKQKIEKGKCTKCKVKPIKAKGLCGTCYSTQRQENIKNPQFIIEGSESGQIMREIRKRLRDLEALTRAVIILGRGDQALKEIEMFMQRFI